MIAKVDIASVANRYEIGRIIIHFVMVDMMHYKRAPMLNAGNAAMLADLAVAFSDLSFQFIRPIRAIGKFAQAALPGRIIGARYITSAIRRCDIGMPRIRSIFNSTTQAIFGSICTKPFNPFPRALFGPIVRIAPLFSSHALEWRRAEPSPFIRCGLTFLKTGFNATRIMPMSVGCWFALFIDGRNQSSATAGTFYLGHGIPLRLFALLIPSLFFCGGKGHAFIVSVWPVRGGG